MNFKHSAFIENTPEMREWLEGLGYKRFSNTDGNTLCTIHDGGYNLRNYSLGKTRFQVYLSMINPIDCRNNPDLFKAITAILTTTDIGKHYINNHTGQWRRCDYTMATDESIDWSDWGEATLEELIEHFKK